MHDVSFVLVGLVAVALAFDFLNGLHDAANSIATIVSTRVLRPQYAVFWAAFFNFIAFMFFGLHVATTVGSGIVSPEIVDDQVIFGALMGAISWNLLTWLLGIPSSSSHALIGGLIGAGAAKAGSGAIVWSGFTKTGLAIVLSPALGFFLALAAGAGRVLAVRQTNPAQGRRQLSPAAVSLRFALFARPRRQRRAKDHGHHLRAALQPCGGGRRVSACPCGWCSLARPRWDSGTLFGGWRIVHTMGSKITRLTPMQGFCAETGGAITLFTATALGVPVSTTHTITGAIVGVGAARRVSAVRWNVARDIVIAWVVTMPMAALIAALFFALTRRFG